LRLTTTAMRCIDKAGGFDNYILNTKPQWLGQGLGMQLKEEMTFVKLMKNAQAEKEVSGEERDTEPVSTEQPPSRV
jgi:hypothetical protein